MWGTIVGGILGFLASVLPKVFELVEGYFRHIQDHAMQAQQIEAVSKGVTLVRPESTTIVAGPVEGEVPAPGIPPELDTTAPAITDTNDANDADTDGAPGEPPSFFADFFATLRASVRPVITYGFFVLFLFVKLKGLYQGMIVDHTPVIQLLPIVWDEGTESLFAAILAFWFGSRAFEKSRALVGKP